MKRRVFVALLLAALVFTPQLQAELPLLLNFNCRQGQTFSYPITWCSGVTSAQCQAGSGLVNLTGYTAKLQLRDTRTGAVIDEFTDSTGLALGGAAGTITWTMTATETGVLPVGSLNYDLRLTSGTSVVTYLLYGHLNVRARVTQ